MKNLNPYKYFKESNDSYKLPASSGDSDKDEEIFWFSTEDKNKSIILNLIIDKLNSSKVFGDVENAKWTNLVCFYEPGDDSVQYTLEFTTPDDKISKETDGSVEGHEWQLIAEVPSNIISKLNSGEITVEQGEKEIKSKISWSYKDGLDKSIGGWQLETIDGYKQRTEWLSKEKENDSKNPKWIQKFSTWLTDKFA